jgi:hypothetical protein
MVLDASKDAPAYRAGRHPVGARVAFLEDLELPTIQTASRQPLPNYQRSLTRSRLTLPLLFVLNSRLPDSAGRQGEDGRQPRLRWLGEVRQMSAIGTLQTIEAAAERSACWG